MKDVLVSMVPPTEATSIVRGAVLSFQPKPRMVKATLESRGWTASGGQSSDGAQKAGVVVPYPIVSRIRAQQVAESERLGKPATAAVLEKALGVGAGDVPGDKDDAAGQRWRCRSDSAIKRHPVDTRHLQIADHDVVRLLPHTGEGLLAVVRMIDLQARIR